VIRGDHGSRGEHVGLGALVGGVVGALAVRHSARDSNTGVVNSRKLLAGVAVGALAGGAVGFAVPAGPLWVRAGTARPLRVIAGLNVRPGLEVALSRPESH
jgi:ABC-type enterobactin transport system permease subunit